MGMRITTGMAMNTYRYNLQLSTGNMTNSRNKVLTKRQFDSFAENPSGAIQAWRVRRAMVNNNSYLNNNSDTYSRFRIAWETMGMINTKLIDEASRKADLYAENDPTAGGRPATGKVMSDTADSIVQAMNSAKFGSHFVFSGDDEMNAPFSWSVDGKTLLYRGVNVNAGGVKAPNEAPKWASSPISDVTGLPEDMPSQGKNAVEDAWIAYYKNQKEIADFDADPDPNKDPADRPAALTKPLDLQDPFANSPKDKYEVPEDAYGKKESTDEAERLWATYYLDQGDKNRLDMLANEYENVDLGMGLQEDADGKLVDGTAFNRALPGIDMLGYGVDKNGDPNNVVMIMKRLGEIYGAADPETGKLDPDDARAAELTKEADRLMDKLKEGRQYTAGKYVEIDTKAHFLTENQDRLEMQEDYLAEERVNIENVDLADAITEFSWDYYCYSAALKVGTQLLSQSLIDYMS